MLTPLEVIQSKVRELGGKQVRELFSINSNSFNTMVANISPLTPEFEQAIKEKWPSEFAETHTTGFKAEPGANQLSFSILSPVRNTYDPSTTSSAVGLIRRTGCGWCQRPFDSMIARSRNLLASAFIRSDAEWSFWLDDDMVIPNGNAAWFREQISDPIDVSDEFLGMIAPYQLASWGKTIVSGVYPSRHNPTQFTAGFHPGSKIVNRLPHRTLMPIRYCGFGCVMVHRKVYEDIIAKHPELWPDPGSECQVFSTFTTTDGRMPGEDESFCLRARECGHETFLDLSVLCGHVIRKVSYPVCGIIP